jgi:transcriptional regulator NrdR family protein
MRCIACGNTHTRNINHKQADDGQVWLTKQCIECKTKWNIHFNESNRELKRLIKSGNRNAAILLNMRGSGNSFTAATEIVERIEKWVEEEKT